MNYWITLQSIIIPRVHFTYCGTDLVHGSFADFDREGLDGRYMIDVALNNTMHPIIPLHTELARGDSSGQIWDPKRPQKYQYEFNMIYRGWNNFLGTGISRNPHGVGYPRRIWQRLRTTTTSFRRTRELFERGRCSYKGGSGANAEDTRCVFATMVDNTTTSVMENIVSSAHTSEPMPAPAVSVCWWKN